MITTSFICLSKCSKTTLRHIGHVCSLFTAYIYAKEQNETAAINQNNNQRVTNSQHAYSTWSTVPHTWWDHMTDSMWFHLWVQITTEAQGKSWCIEMSSARNYIPHTVQGRLATSTSSPRLSTTPHDTASTSGTSKMTTTRSFTSAAGSSLEESYGLSRSESFALLQRPPW